MSYLSKNNPRKICPVCKDTGKTWKNLPSGVLDKSPRGVTYCWCPVGEKMEKKKELRDLLMGVKS